jgi:hypothetical protein
MTKKWKTKTKTERAYFGPGYSIGGYDKKVVVADINGKLWQIDCETGHAKPVTFGK